MDSRTVISCLPYEIDDSAELASSAWLDSSFRRDAACLHSNEAILSWFTEMKFQYELEVARIPLREAKGWEKTEYKAVWLVNNSPYKDEIFKKDFPVGKVEIPEHVGKAGTVFGVGNMAVIQVK